MLALLQAIVARFNAVPALSSAFGGADKVFWQRVPPGTTPRAPYCVLRTPPGRPPDSFVLSGEGRTHPRVEVAVYADKAEQALSLAVAVQSAIDVQHAAMQGADPLLEEIRVAAEARLTDAGGQQQPEGNVRHEAVAAFEADRRLIPA